MKQAAGTLLYRTTPEGLEVLLVHPSGNYNKHAPFSIPKGLLDEGEDRETAARRETREEAGVEAGALVYLGHCDYKKSKKRVHCFAGPAPQGEPAPASWEIDQARFVPIDDARKILHGDQQVFLDHLLAHLAKK
jgi:predicted NUDIX family NTP pyrophosphohydrolase